MIERTAGDSFLRKHTMSHTYHVVDTSAYSFIEKFVQAVKNGYYLSSTTEHWPSDTLIMKQVVLFKDPDMPVHKGRLGLPVGQVQAYDRFEFLKQVQQFVIEGYEPDMDSLYWGVQKSIAFVASPPPARLTETDRTVDTDGWDGQFAAEFSLKVVEEPASSEAPTTTEPTPPAPTAKAATKSKSKPKVK